MSRERLIIGAVAFALLLGVLAADWTLESHLGSLLALTAIGVLAQMEVFPLLRRMGLDAYPAYGVAVAAGLFLFRGLAGYLGLSDGEVQAATLVLFAAAFAGPLVKAIATGGAGTRGGREEYERAAVTSFALLLVWFLFSFLLELRLVGGPGGGARTGLELTVVLLLSVKLGDSSAYFVGRTVGVTPLTWVSPRKTWEGAAGSVAGAILVTLLVGGLLFGYNWLHMLLFGLLTNVAGQFGDLVESLLKRRAGVKDSGSLFREMGGFLDLIDSLLFAAPVGYLFVRLVVLESSVPVPG
jgi:phosphatidate cytidylyltransferase